MSDNEETRADLLKAQREEFARLVSERGGRLTAQDLLTFATTPTRALHSAFEWDDAIAGPAYRLHQAEMMLRLKYTILPGPDQTPLRVRAMVSLPSDRGSGIYTDIKDVLSNVTMLAELEGEYARELRAIQVRRKILAKLSPLYQRVEALISPAA